MGESSHDLILRSPPRILAAVLILTLAWTSSAQQVPPLSKRAAAIRQNVERLPPNAEITVVPIHGQKDYGTIVSHDQESFTLYDIDRKANVTLKYADVKGIKDGYRGRKSFTTRHPQLKRGIIVTTIAMGVMVLVAVLAALELRKS